LLPFDGLDAYQLHAFSWLRRGRANQASAVDVVNLQGSQQGFWWFTAELRQLHLKM